MFLSKEELNEILKTVTSGYKSPDDEFFSTVNSSIFPKFKKLGVITSEDINALEEEGKTLKEDVIDCNVPGCLQTFKTVSAYQTHYNALHRYFCATCKRTFPTPHLLDLHFSESHDQYFQARVDRGESMFVCYLEECKQTMLTPEARREHCITEHRFPSNFRFDQMSGSTKNKQNKSKGDVEAKGNTRKKAFSFGHNTDRCFNKACTERKARVDGATLENMNDLMDALEE